MIMVDVGWNINDLLLEAGGWFALSCTYYVFCMSLRVDVDWTLREVQVNALIGVSPVAIC